MTKNQEAEIRNAALSIHSILRQVRDGKRTSEAALILIAIENKRIWLNLEKPSRV